MSGASRIRPSDAGFSGLTTSPAVVTADEPFRPDMASLAVHFHFRDFRYDGRTAERVRNAASGQDVSISSGARVRRRARIPAIRIRGRFQDCDGTGAPECGIVSGVGSEKLHPEFVRIGFSRRAKQLINRNAIFGSKGRLRAVGIAQISCAQRRLPDERQAHHLSSHAAVGDQRTFRMAWAELPLSGLARPDPMSFRAINTVSGLVIAHCDCSQGCGRCSRRPPTGPQHPGRPSFLPRKPGPWCPTRSLLHASTGSGRGVPVLWPVAGSRISRRRWR